ncbi:MAG: polymerase sigma-70 factor, subfamily [Acidimicrobiaceae bacterium]|jgi:RNA polymerase sigma-70 factor (ECF subfamily)
MTVTLVRTSSSPLSPGPPGHTATLPRAASRGAGRPRGATIDTVMGSTPSEVSTAELQGLVDRARHRDPDAWETLYRLSYAGLLAYARRRLWGLTEADDAVSETFTRACHRIADFEWKGGGFNAWLFGILRNVMLEAQRTDRRASLVDSGPGQVEDVCLDGLLRDEEALAVRAAFATLSPEDQELLELRVVGGLCAEEVGLVVGKRAGAVRMAQSRALARLRSALETVSADD